MTSNTRAVRLFYFLLTTLIVFLTEPFISYFFYEASFPIHKSLQEQAPEWMFTFSVYFIQIANKYFFVVIALILFNCLNIYKAFTFICVINCLSYILGILKLFYLQARPFYQDTSLFRGGCDGSWGNPGATALSGVVGYFSLFSLIVTHRRVKNNTVAKVCLLAATVTIISLLMFCSFLLGHNAINQQIFGLELGLLIYTFVFHILNVSLNNSDQFVKIFKWEPVNLAVSTFILLCLPILLYLYSFENLVNQQIYKNIREVCPHLESNNILNENAWIQTAVIVFIFFFYVSIKMEYNYLRNGNQITFIKANFAIESKNALISQLYDNIDDMQWNHTSLMKTFGRIVIFGIIIIVLSIPHFLISAEVNIFFFYFIAYIIPLSCTGIVINFGSKLLFEKLNLVNNRN